MPRTGGADREQPCNDSPARPLSPPGAQGADEPALQGLSPANSETFASMQAMRRLCSGGLPSGEGTLSRAEAAAAALQPASNLADKVRCSSTEPSPCTRLLV